MRKTILSTAFAALAMIATPALAQDNVRVNKAIEVLEEGHAALGLFTGNFSLANARGLARSNLDFIFIDMEHSAFNTETLQTFLIGMTDKAAIARNGHLQQRTTPIVRIPMNGRESLEWQVKQVLDMGVMGVMIPYVETAEEVERAVRAVRYPQPRGSDIMEPAGLRGSGASVASWYWGIPDYTQKADVWPLNPQGEILLVIQIESELAVQNAEEMMSVPGVGAIFIGPADLSMSMGLPGQRRHPEVVAAKQHVLDLCIEKNIPCGITAGANNIEEYLEMGYKFPTVGYWGDAGIGDGTFRALQIGREADNRTD